MDLLWTDFLNSVCHDWRGNGRSEDRLDQPAWQQEFLDRWQIRAPVPAGAADLAAMREFRTLLQRMVEGLCTGAPLPPEEMAALNAVMAGGPVLRQVVQGRLDLIAARQDWAQVLAEVAAAFASTLTGGEGARVRCCENPNCRWVFYDDTRNRTKRYCDEKLCGNLMKVRRFRARKKAES